MAKGPRSNEPRFPVDPAADVAGPAPADQRPGHHPQREQDKPVGPPPTPHAWPDGTRTYPFDFERRLTPAAFLVGVTPWNRGVTFATSTRAGVCIRFHDPVPALDPLGKILHPAATCTVTDAEEAASLIDNRASIAAQADR